jgi:hypothetical protein
LDETTRRIALSIIEEKGIFKALYQPQGEHHHELKVYLAAEHDLTRRVLSERVKCMQRSLADRKSLKTYVANRLSPLGFIGRQAEILNQRALGTGKWFLVSQEYWNWAGPSPSNYDHDDGGSNEPTSLLSTGIHKLARHTLERSANSD